MRRLSKRSGKGEITSRCGGRQQGDPIAPGVICACLVIAVHTVAEVKRRRAQAAALRQEAARVMAEAKAELERMILA